MGKKRYLNNFITKWIKSDLPEDCSTVLLLGVTRIPTSPLPPRRPTSLPHNKQPPESPKPNRGGAFKNRRALVRRNSSKKWRNIETQDILPCSRNVPDILCAPSGSDDSVAPPEPCTNPPTKISNESYVGTTVMDRSVDSIGTCSLDIDASIIIPDLTDKSSTGTLKSASILSPAPPPHLPSYINLACTVNGYSTTTNYDPQRVIKSRDASPNRWDFSNLTPAYSVQNALLSPPNLVPLPTEIDKNMAEQTLTQHHHQFYSTSKTIEFCSKESRFSSSFLTPDNVDACFDNKRINSKSIHFKSEISTNITNGQKQYESVLSRQEISNDKETKSFIQQRVERLYGPGALAQGFFVTKRQSKRSSESDKEASLNCNVDNHSKSMNDQLLLDTIDDKQCSNNHVLPVLRHLRPEFRAQLPIVSPRKSGEKAKIVDVKSNGVCESQAADAVEIVINPSDVVEEESSEKDGRYFLKILDRETTRLLKLADNCENELNADLPEEMVGKIHSAAGKAKLLVSQKMQQFKGLCTNNITQVKGEKFPTTNEDLQGFWDMVMLQVDQVDNLFREIDKLKSNGWKEEIEEKKPQNNGNVNKVKKVVNRTQNASNIEARKQRELERKRLIEERRKAMKNKNKLDDNVEIFVPESS